MKSELPLIHSFLNRNVTVKVEESLIVKGKLLYYRLGKRVKPHKPHVLILENSLGKIIVRGNYLLLGENHE
jgi:hypothetical protein